MTEPATPTFGQDLLRRARDNGLTSEDLALILGLSVPRIRAGLKPSDLQDYPVQTLRELAERLNLPWPGWLTTTATWPDPPAPDDRQDPARVHAVLSAAFETSLSISEIAHVLDWTTTRVRTAADRLAARNRTGAGTRLIDTGDTLTLRHAPRMLDPAARQRLAQRLHAHGQGPRPAVLHLIYELLVPHDRGGMTTPTADAFPDLLDEAVDYGLVTREVDPATGAVTSLKLDPAVAYSLGIAPDPLDDPPTIH